MTTLNSKWAKYAYKNTSDFYMKGINQMSEKYIKSPIGVQSRQK